MLEELFPTAASEKEWIPFWGSYLSGILTISATMIVLYLTINQNKKQLEAQLKNQISSNIYNQEMIWYDNLRQQISQNYDYLNTQRITGIIISIKSEGSLILALNECSSILREVESLTFKTDSLFHGDHLSNPKVQDYNGVLCDSINKYSFILFDIQTWINLILYCVNNPKLSLSEYEDIHKILKQNLENELVKIHHNNNLELLNLKSKLNIFSFSTKDLLSSKFNHNEYLIYSCKNEMSNVSTELLKHEFDKIEKKYTNNSSSI